MPPLSNWTILQGAGSSTTPESVGQPTAVALSPTPTGWGTNPRYRVADDGVSQLVDVSIRITPANDSQTAGFDIVMDKATGVLTPIEGYYPYTGTVPAPQDFVVTDDRPQTTQTWWFVVGTRGHNGAFNSPDESIAATKTSAVITGYSPGTGASPAVSGFSVAIIDDVGSPVPQSHFKFTFTPPVDPNYYSVKIYMIFCDNPTLHSGNYVPSAGATQFLVAGARTSPSEQTSWWPRGSVGSWITATCIPENKLGIPSGASTTYNFPLPAAGTGTLPANIPALPVTGFSVSIIDDPSSPVQQSHFKFFFTVPTDPNWYSVRFEMIFCDNPTSHSGAYVPAAGQQYFLVAGARANPSEQTSWWPRGSLPGYILAKATSINLAGVANDATAVTYGFTIPAASGSRIPDNTSVGPVTGFSVVIVDDPASPTQQSHFRFLFTIPQISGANDPNWYSVRFDMVFCDDPALHGGAYVQKAGERYFLVCGARASPSEQSTWWPRGSIPGYLTARGVSINFAGIANDTTVAFYGFTVPASDGGRIPANNPTADVTSFLIAVIDDPASPVPQSHFRITFVPPSDPNYALGYVEMVYCDDPASHGGIFVPSAGAGWFTVMDGIPQSPAEQTGWWPRGTVQTWLTARFRSINLLGQRNADGPRFFFTITPSTGARLNNVDSTTVGVGLTTSGSQLTTRPGPGLKHSGGAIVVDAGATIDTTAGPVIVKLGTIDSTHLAPGSLGQDLSKFANSTRPIVVISGLPSLPNANYPNGALIFNTANGKNYRNVSGTWTVGTDPADLIAGTIAAGVIYAGTITATQVNSGGFTGITLSLNLNGITTTINNSTGVLGPTGVQVASNSNPQMTQMCVNGFIVNNNAGSGAHAGVLYFDVGGTNAGTLVLYPASGAATVSLSGGASGSASLVLNGSAASISMSGGGSIVLGGTGFVDAGGGYKVAGTIRLTANGGYMPRQPGNFATLAALSTSLGANWVNGELLLYFNTTTSKQTFAFKDNLGTNHDLGFTT